MQRYPTPTTKQWTKANTSDLFGNMWVTKNLTFDTHGYMTLSYSPRAAMTRAVDTDFKNPAAILYNETMLGYFIQTWGEAFSVGDNILQAYPVQLTESNAPVGAVQSDAVWFGGFMPVSASTSVKYFDPNQAFNFRWITTNISLTNTSLSQHPTEVMVSLSALAVADVNTVKLYAFPLTTTPTLLTTLTILSDFYITNIVYFNQNLYIATMNRYGGHAFMYVWNGLGTAASQAYEVDSNIIFDLCVFQDQIVLVTGNGSLLGFNGSSFDLLDAFPIYYTPQALVSNSNIGMYHSMLRSNGNLLYINFNNAGNDFNRLLTMPDGIWCYDRNVGLYHRYSPSNALVVPNTIATADVNTTTNQITVAAAPVTGTEMYYNRNGGTALAPLTSQQKYFIIKVDATHIKLAYTKAQALAGTEIDLTGTGSSGQLMVFFPNVDFGAAFQNRTQAAYVIERPVSFQQYGTDVIYGGEVYNRVNDSTNWETMNTVSTGVESRGYFISPKVFSSNVTDNFNLFTLKFSKMTSELDKIIIKYRTTDDMRDYITIGFTGHEYEATWTSTNTFTTTETAYADAEVGNEVEFFRGAAGGLLAHITNIVNVAGTYTVTLDETYDNYASGDKSTVVFKNWKKLETIAYGDSNAVQEFYSKQIGKDGKFLQLKIELRGIQTRIEEALVDNIYRLLAKTSSK